VGLAVLCLALGHLLFRGPWLDLQGKTYDWAQYAVAGIVFPTLLFGIPLLWRWRNWPTANGEAVKRVLMAVCLAAFVVFFAASMAQNGAWSGILATLLAFAQVLVMTQPWRNLSYDISRALAIFVFATIGWTVAVSLELFALLQSPFLLAGFIVAFLLVGDAARDRPEGVRLDRVRPRTPANLIALAIIAFMSLRTEGLFEVLGERGALHHWSAWVGTADLMREGHWLLWDAPSNYGSLNVLAFAFVPTATPWQSFYLFQALAFFIVSASIFLILRTLGPSPINWVFALGTAIAVPMFMPTFDAANPVTATFIFPNWGAYRYVWAFVLVVVLIGERLAVERGRRHAVMLAAGCLVWVISVLWSPESAFFCTGAWLPAYVAIVLRSTTVGPGRIRRALGWLSLPFLLLGGALGLTAAIFANRLGHLPDWESYIDYAREVGLNVLVVSQQPVGPATGLLLGFCLLAIGAVYAGTRAGLPTRSFGLWIGLLGAFWATNSYGYQRGLPTLHPVSYTALGILLVLAARAPFARSWSTLARAGAMPLLILPLIAPLAAGFGDPLAITTAFSSFMETARHRFDVTYLLPDADPELQALMAEADIQPEDPVFYAADYLGNPLLPWRPAGATNGPRIIRNPQWTPGHPALALRWIPPGRGAVYTERYLERTPMSGWLIQSKTGIGATADFNGFAGGLEPWFFVLVSKTHVPTRIYESENWQAVWFDYVGDRPEIARPDFAWDRLGPLPPDISVNEKSLHGTTHPEVWTVFGAGWGLYDSLNENRAMGSSAVLWIFSPDERAARIRTTPSYVSDRTKLSVAPANAPRPRYERIEADHVASFDVWLKSGWNRVSLDLKGDRPRAPDASQEGLSSTNALQRGITMKKIDIVVDEQDAEK